MVYSVGEMAELLGIPASTLRYYDKEGLLPFVERTPGGARRFQEKDIEWLRVIGCMKQAGMSIREIRVYMELAAQGDASIGARRELFCRQRETLKNRITELQHTLEMVEYKCWYYEAAQAAGTMEKMRTMPEEDVPERFRAIRQEFRKMPGRTPERPTDK